MSFPPPPDEPDDEDTGPLHVTATPSDSTWTPRFDAPLTVSPRPVPVRVGPNPKILLGTVGAVVAVALVGGLTFWLTRPTSDSEQSPTAAPSTSASPTSDGEDEGRLMRSVPGGYPSDACDGGTPPKNALAQVNCTKNTDAGGPVSATYTLASDKASLDAYFNDSVKTVQRVNCPGNIQSPGPWRRNATPQTVSGTLFCGLREGRPTVVWTDDAKLVVSAVESAPDGPTFPALYAWWSSHS